MRWTTLLSLLLLLAAPLSGCVGEDDGADDGPEDEAPGDMDPEDDTGDTNATVPPEPDQAPVAAFTVSIGDVTIEGDLEVTEEVGSEVEITLDGSASADPEGDDLTYAWTVLVSGVEGLTEREVSEGATAMVTVTAPAAVSVQLAVSDGGERTDRDVALVLVHGNLTAEDDVPAPASEVPGSTAAEQTNVTVDLPLATPLDSLFLASQGPAGHTLLLEDANGTELVNETADETGNATASLQSLAAAGTYTVRLVFPACGDAAPVLDTCPREYDPGTWRLEAQVRMGAEG